MHTQITCPQCAVPYQVEVHQIIDVGQQPELKQMLLAGELNVAVCPNCGVGGQLSTTVLYHDPAHELFMIHLPQEMNLDQVQREQMIGQLTRQVMDNMPGEQRKAYLLQPQTILNMQTFMEKVLATEGITSEMIARQKEQVSLLQTLAKADKDVVEHLLKERANEIDETFFAMLKSYIDRASQMNDNSQLIPLVNLQAKLMVETPTGRQLEKQQIALHAFNQEAKKQNGLSPDLLLKHILLHQKDQGIVNQLTLAGGSAMTYEFFVGLTAEIEKQAKAGHKANSNKLVELRTGLLKVQENMRQQSEQLMKKAQETLETLLTAPDKEAAIRSNVAQIDDVFMNVLSASIAQATEKKLSKRARGLNEIYEHIMKQAEGQAPPEIQFLNKLVQSEKNSDRHKLIEENQHFLSADLVDVVESLIDQLSQNGQPSALIDRLQEVKVLIEAKI